MKGRGRAFEIEIWRHSFHKRGGSIVVVLFLMNWLDITSQNDDERAAS
jgi:hypothetical protein